MSYLVLARKWRPKIFKDVVGQEHVLKALTNALANQKLHHAYLFSGTRGVGKTTIARVFAKALNCETGLTAEPCGSCSSCQGIDEGRFVDLIEVDAASKTKVEDTRDLLDNVQFSPTNARYKVYLIDEVHMLSKHSFNALLKTLEEPPPHVKFLLATTDPKKLPITVLSRCLQFNLTKLSSQLISERMKYICKEEDIAASSSVLTLISKASDGSLRDALSLLDQAIAYCDGKLSENSVNEMLGTIDKKHVQLLLTHLAEDNSSGLLDVIFDIDQEFPDYDKLLEDLARYLQRIAIYQSIGKHDTGDDLSEGELEDYAEKISMEDIQLFYQIAIIGRRDLSLSPDPRSGVEMTLLRMLAFKPAAEDKNDSQERVLIDDGLKKNKNDEHKIKEQNSSYDTEIKENSSKGHNDINWSDLLEELNLDGTLKLLAGNCVYVKKERNIIFLNLDNRSESLYTKEHQKHLAKILSSHLGEELEVKISIKSKENESPIQQKERAERNVREEARLRLENDSNIKAIKKVFGATVKSDSIKLKKK